MKEWFKARNLWGSVIDGLSDEDAGRLAKALWKYTMTGEKTELSGMLGGVFLMITATLEADEAESKKLSEKRAIAGSSGGNQRVANQANEANEANEAIASNDNDEANEASEAIADIKNKNKNKSKNIDKEIDKREIKEREPQKRFTPPTIEDVAEYCKSRNNGIDPERFVAFYESKGWKVGNQPMKDWKACVITWEKRDKKQAPVKTVVAQQYEQRDYGGTQAELMAEQDREMEEYMRREKSG